MKAKRVNCLKDYRFQVRIQVPGTNGKLRDAIAGEVTTVKMRLSTTPTGAAIDAAVGNLPLAENSAAPALQFYTVDASLLTTWILPLLRGTSFYAIYSRTGDFDDEYTEFIVDDRDDVG